jgi:hypothetical protein
MISRSVRNIKFILLLIIALAGLSELNARDYKVTGIVHDLSGAGVADATVSMTIGSVSYSAISGPDGTYSLRISGVYTDVTGTLETGVPFPNPFSYSVSIPLIINSSGDILFAVYNMAGQKIREIRFPAIGAGSYRIIWDGCNQNGSPQRTGYYAYAITFKGVTRSGRLVKAGGGTNISSGTSLEPVMRPPIPPEEHISRRIFPVTNVTHTGYYPVRLTDISLAGDTLINFDLTLKQILPFKTSGSYIAMHTGSDYRSLILKGINLGSSPPGFFPGEIAYAIDPETYERWINRIGEAGFNCIRIYTLHPPSFYEKLANYNYRHPGKPLLLFQGIWLEEVEDNSISANDLFNKEASFTKEIREVTDCINGSGDIAFRPGKAYGKYMSDISRWTAGYIIGREISPREISVTNSNHPSATSSTGNQFSISSASPAEVFITRSLDETATYESQKYNISHPVSISNWPTLDPMTHPTELNSDEDAESFDISRIAGKELNAGLFASYHAYPYYPNFISNDPLYRAVSDDTGPDSYLGYLADLKSHYSDIPLVIAEFGVPSSWGSAHQSFSNMHHGGYSAKQQGEKDLRMMNNIIDANCAGGFIFSWFDEWFKPTWIVGYLEAFGTLNGTSTIPTRQLWHNLASPEQNFGLITFDQKNIPAAKAMTTDKPSGPIKKISATSDNSCLYINIERNGTFSSGDTIMIAFDTYLEGVGESLLPNGKSLVNRSEFLLEMILGRDTAFHMVTQAYDMNGLTPRFDRSDQSVQKFYSTISNGAPWKTMQWINDDSEPMADNIGLLPAERSVNYLTGNKSAIEWSSSAIKIRIPWTLLYFYDPTQMKVIDGAFSNDGGYTYNIMTSISDGIAISVYCNGSVTSTTERYSWPQWQIVPETVEREKSSLHVIEQVLRVLPGFAR